MNPDLSFYQPCHKKSQPTPVQPHPKISWGKQEQEVIHQCWTYETGKDLLQQFGTSSVKGMISDRTQIYKSLADCFLIGFYVRLLSLTCPSTSLQLRISPLLMQTSNMLSCRRIQAAFYYLFPHHQSISLHHMEGKR